jgi:hypothetical protein
MARIVKAGKFFRLEPVLTAGMFPGQNRDNKYQVV